MISFLCAIPVVILLVAFLVGITSKDTTVKSNGFVWDRTIPQFVFQHQVEMILRGCDSSEETISRAILNHYIKGKTFEQAMQAYLDVCSTVGNIQHKLFGDPFYSSAGWESDSSGYSLTCAIARLFVKNIPLTTEQVDQINKLIHPGFFSVRPEWFVSRLEALKDSAELEQIHR